MTKGVNGIFTSPDGATYKKDANGKMVKYTPSNEEKLLIRSNIYNLIYFYYSIFLFFL